MRQSPAVNPVLYELKFGMSQLMLIDTAQITLLLVYDAGTKHGREL